jgi:hypothetical protein
MSNYERFAARSRAWGLHHGHYRIGLYPALAPLAAGQPVGDINRKEEARGRIQIAQRALPGAYSYSMLTKTGCEWLGVSTDLAKPLTECQLEEAIALSYACHLDGPRRHRISPKELRAMLSDDAPPDSVPHVVSTESGAPTLYRVVLAATADTVVRRLRDTDQQLTDGQLLTEWWRQGRYGVALLSPTPEQARAVRRKLADASLPSHWAVIVAVGPTSETFAYCVRRRRRGAL